MLAAMSTSSSSRMRRWFNRTGSEALGWLLVLLGIVMLVMPGPGLLAMVAGIALLARHYTWADRIFEPLYAKAVDGAKYGVATWPRIAVSILGIISVLAVGTVWFINPTIGTFEFLGVTFGPGLPGGGWPGAIGIWLGGVIGAVLLVYSIRRWR